ncbi:MAG: hypothetical protein U9Q07_04100 [Planctomycetota bacterium]|nr:hypothetical protein [Planctomycetota bacterium]
MSKTQKQITSEAFDSVIKLLKEMKTREKKSENGVMAITITQSRNIRRQKTLFDISRGGGKVTQCEETTVIKIVDNTQKDLNS